MIFDSVPTVFVQDNAVGLIFSYIRLCIDQCLLGQQSQLDCQHASSLITKQDKSDFDPRERRKKPNTDTGIHFEWRTNVSNTIYLVIMDPPLPPSPPLPEKSDLSVGIKEFL